MENEHSGNKSIDAMSGAEEEKAFSHADLPKISITESMIESNRFELGACMRSTTKNYVHWP